MAWFKRRNQRSVEPATEPGDIWVICPSCKAHIYKSEWDKALRVCPKCDYHDKLTCHERVQATLDAGTFREFDADIPASDPLRFVDAGGSYAEKAKATEAKVGLREAVLTGMGKIEGLPVVVAVMDFRFIGGSLSGGTGEKILLASNHALRHRRPFIVFSASGGARMQEGTVSLMQMAKTCAGIARLHHGRVPYISVMTDPTFGGVSASYAMVGDINVAEPHALIGFAGRRVIEQTIKQSLPEDFQTAEYLLAHGFIDRIVPRGEMKAFLHHVLRYWQRG